MYGLLRTFQVRKKWKMKEVSDFTENLQGFVLLVYDLKEIMQKLF